VLQHKIKKKQLKNVLKLLQNTVTAHYYFTDCIIINEQKGSVVHVIEHHITNAYETVEV
jgi:bifunctional N-acetylglucosamine-1-phosphate-uridyltransferase/glucosamine-1-phosphate-acetyltransferase GlmU-like protein